MSKVILICGKIASGKTYYANYLKDKENAVILSTDEVTYDLTNNKQGEGYDAFAKKVNNYLRKKALEIVKCGCNVILDWGFWTKEDRKNITEYFNENSAEIEWHYIDIDDKTWHENIEERNKLVEEGKGGSSFYVDEGLLNKLLTMFEEPEKGEMDFIYKLKRQKIERNEKMQYLDKYKKEQFRNVYFITGTATGGKTTISNELSKKYGFFRYDVDEEFDKHQKLSNPKDKPAMNKTFRNADEFFLRPKDEYVDWLLKNTQEQMEFILDDLIELSRNQIVVCDLHLTVEEAEKIANENQVVFLIRESNDNIIEDYCNRKSHEGFNKFINSSTNPSLAKKNCNEVLKDINEKRCNDIKASKFLWIERNENSTIEKTLELVEKHFGLIDKDISREKIIEIKKVDNNTELKNKLLEFIKNFHGKKLKNIL